jgi:hypothetical protein
MPQWASAPASGEVGACTTLSRERTGARSARNAQACVSLQSHRCAAAMRAAALQRRAGCATRSETHARQAVCCLAVCLLAPVPLIDAGAVQRGRGSERWRSVVCLFFILLPK